MAEANQSADYIPARINEMVLNSYRQVANSILSTRAQYLDVREADPRRNYYKECGYPDLPSLELYQSIYERGDIGYRVVNVYPEETWAVDPVVYEDEGEDLTPFEKGLAELLQQIPLWSYANRVDELSGIGEFGILYYGFDDGLSPDQCVTGIDPVTGQPIDGKIPSHKLLFIRPFEQRYILINGIDTNPNSPRYGLPTSYQIQTADPRAFTVGPTETIPVTTTTVHWTRVEHIADNKKSSEIAGMPRLRPVLNRVLDVGKVAGGSSEMFWKGAFPGYSIEAYPDLTGLVTLDPDSVRKQMDGYMNGLQRYLSFVGMTAKSLAPQVADPTNHITQQLMLICSTIGVPIDVFTGNTPGQLAADQNSVRWNRRLARRQLVYVNPGIVLPIIKRFIAYGVLPPAPKGLKVAWPDMNAMSDKDRADVAVKRTQSMLQYVSSGAETIMPLHQYFTMILGLTEAEAQAIIKANKAATGTLATEQVWGAMNAGPAGQGGGDPALKTGASGKKNGQANAKKKP